MRFYCPDCGGSGYKFIYSNQPEAEPCEHCNPDGKANMVGEEEDDDLENVEDLEAYLEDLEEDEEDCYSKLVENALYGDDEDEDDL